MIMSLSGLMMCFVEIRVMKLSLANCNSTDTLFSLNSLNQQSDPLDTMP